MQPWAHDDDQLLGDKMTRTRLIAAVSMLLAWGASANATPIISIDPTSTNEQLGNSVAVDVNIGGLTGEVIGGFDIDVSYDASVLAFSEVIFGPFLDGPTDSLRSVLLSGATVNAAEVSLGLLLNQDGSTGFTLFSIVFDTIGLGTSALDLNVNDLSDFDGGELDSLTLGGSVNVEEGTTSVPEPSSLSVALLAFALLGASARRRSQPEGPGRG